MKKIKLILFTMLITFTSYGQWTTSGSNIYNTNTGNVGIGTNAPSSKFEVSESTDGTRSLKFGRYPFSMSTLELHDGYRPQLLLKNTNPNPPSGLGAIVFESYDQSQMGALSLNNNSGRKTLSIASGGGDLSFNTGSFGGAERMTVKAFGKIGIGTINPEYDLDIQSAESGWGARLRIRHLQSDINASYAAGLSIDNFNYSAQAQFLIDNNSSTSLGRKGTYFGNPTNTDIGLFTNNIERITVKNDGKIGIGTSGPVETLDINGTARIRTIANDNTQTRLLVSDTNGKVFWRAVSTIVGGDNLGNHSVNQDLSPSVNNVYSLGNLGNGFKNIYFTGKIHYNGQPFLSTSGQNSFIGLSSGLNTTGVNNTFIGYQAGFANTSGERNVYVGTMSGMNALTGNDNVSIGYQAAAFAANSQGCIFIGRGANGNDNLTNAVAIGNDSYVDITNAFILGNSSTRVGILNNSPTYALHVQNAYCDGNTWFDVSDKNLKSNFARIGNDESILSKVMELPVQYWKYNADSSGARHIGPTSQDFHKVFKLGGNEKSIASVDQFGISIAAIQELNKKTEALSEKLNEQQEVISSLLSALSQNKGEEISTEEEVILHQNVPNPFDQSTQIRMNIPQKVLTANLYIYDLQGRQMGKSTIQQRGEVIHTVEGKTLKAGLYLYTLIADGKPVGIKRMILTE